MFYRDINLPALVEIDHSNRVAIKDSLLKNHFYFNRIILFTQKVLFEKYSTYFKDEHFLEVVYVEGGIFEEVNNITIKTKELSGTLFVAFGGGSVIDFVKMFAKNKNRPYITVPSTLSNDAIYSPIARLTDNGVKKSFGVAAPIGIIVNVNIIKEAPEKLLLAGVGDLVSNLSAYKDCLLAIQNAEEAIDHFSMILAKMSVDGILRYSHKDLYSDDFLIQLSMGLILSGFSMSLSGNSRPASGAEHMISHAIDQYFPERSTLHGLQVAWGQIMVEKYLRKESTSHIIIEFYERMGLMKLFQEAGFTDEFFLQLLPLAKDIRDRYTILALLDVNHLPEIK